VFVYYPHFNYPQIGNKDFEFSLQYNTSSTNLKANLRQRFVTKFGQKAFVKYMREKNVNINNMNVNVGAPRRSTRPRIETKGFEGMATSNQLENLNNENHNNDNRNAKRAAKGQKGKKPAAPTARKPVRRARRPQPSNRTLNANKIKEYWTIFSAVSNGRYIPNNNHMRKLIEGARALRLLAPHQAAAWSGSALENRAVQAGIGNKADIVDFRKPPYDAERYAGIDPQWLIKQRNGQPRTRPTYFIKARFSLKPLKEWAFSLNGNAQRNLFRQMLSFANLPNVKLKGEDHVEPDLMFCDPSSKTIHIYELKIGAGKAESVPAEAMQLAKAKKLIQLTLGGDWKVKVHFTPWMFGQWTGTVPLYKNWELPNPKLPTLKQIADTLIKLNSNYKINTVNTSINPNPILPLMNLRLVNSVLIKERLKRHKNAQNGLARIRLATWKKMLQNPSTKNVLLSSIGMNQNLVSPAKLSRNLLEMAGRTARNSYISRGVRANEIPVNWLRTMGSRGSAGEFIAAGPGRGGYNTNEETRQFGRRAPPPKPLNVQQKTYENAKETISLAKNAINSIAASSPSNRSLQNYQKNINSLAQAFGARNVVTNVARAPKAQFLRAYADFLRDHANLSNALNAKLRSMVGTNANAAVKLSMKQVQNARRAEMNIG